MIDSVSMCDYDLSLSIALSSMGECKLPCFLDSIHCAHESRSPVCGGNVEIEGSSMNLLAIRFSM